MSQRLDVALVARGLASSRSQAQALIRAGLVRVDGEPATRPAQQIGEEPISVEGSGVGSEAEWIRRGWVGRGAVKLDHALHTFKVRPAGLRCLDVGASTGGFTQVLLEHGAASVIALDVGHGQLDERISRHPDVRELSGVSVRDVTTELLGGEADLVVGDLSFISLRLVLPALAPVTRAGADVVLLVKPQFEVGREGIGSRGVVRSAAARARVLLSLDADARAAGLVPRGLERSPVTGAHGNVEYLWWLRRASHPGACLSAPAGMMCCGPAPTVLAHRIRALTQEEDG